MNFGNIYINQLRYIKARKKILKMVIAIFIISAIFGFIYNGLFLELRQQIFDQALESIKGKGIMRTIGFIITHNIIGNLLTILLGMTIIYPFFALLFNSYVIGAVTSTKFTEIGAEAFIRLVPHGIFEIPAFLLSIAIGINIGLSIFKKNRKKTYIKNLINGIKFFALVIIPLLIIAGIIEGILIYYAGSSLSSII